MSHFSLRPLGDVLSHRKEFTEIDDLSEYKRVRVRLHAGGLELRDIVRGSDIKTKSQQLCRTHDVIFAEIDAKVGGYGVVPHELDGAIVSGHYFVYEVDTTVADIEYISYALRNPGFQEQVAARGSTNYAAIRAHQVFEYEIPLPPISEQRRIASRLKTLLRPVTRLNQALDQRRPEMLTSTMPVFVDECLKRRADGTKFVRELVDFVSDTVHLGDDPGEADVFIGLQHIEGHTGRRIGSIPLGSEKGRKFRFRPGDVVYGYLRPYLNKVWVADCHGLCSVDQYVLRPRPGFSADILGFTLRSQTVLDAATELTHSLQLPRLRSGLLANIEVPVVPSANTAPIETELRQVTEIVIGLADRRRHQLELARNLVSSALNQAFGEF